MENLLEGINIPIKAFLKAVQNLECMYKTQAGRERVQIFWYNLKASFIILIPKKIWDIILAKLVHDFN